MHQLEKFLKDLSKITQEHGFVIGGCGCCGSPFIQDIRDVQNSRCVYLAEDLEYDIERMEYGARIKES